MPIGNFAERRQSLLRSLPIETKEIELPENPREPIAKPTNDFEARRQILMSGGAQAEKKNNPFFSGGTLSKAVDILSIGQYASAGAARKIFGLEKNKTFGGSIVDGIRQRASYLDIVQEKLPYEASVDWKKNIVPELWRAGLGLAGDIVLDPTLFLGKLGIVSKATTRIGKEISTVSETIPAVKKAGEFIGKGVIPRFNQPELFKELDKSRIIEESLIEDRVAQMTAPVIKESRAVQKRIAQIIKGGITTNESLNKFAEPIRKELDRVGEAISKINPKLLSEETFQENKGTYFPRLYTKHEFPSEEQRLQQFFGKKPLRIPGERFKKRTEIPEEIRTQMGEIKEAGFPALKGLTQLGVAETRAKFFKTIAEKFSSEDLKEGFLQLPESKLLGDLSGKFVEPSIHDVIQKMIRVPSKVEEIYLNALQTWKAFKTAFNPATITRNNLTNLFVLNPLGGVPPYRLDLYAEAVKELTTQGKYLQDARQMGLNISSQAATELKRKSLIMYGRDRGLLSQFFDTSKAFYQKVVDFYGNQDKVAKLANYIKGVREDGLSPLQAMNRANLYLVDYSDVPEFINTIRKSPIGIPFISFTYGVSRPLAKTLLERPDKLTAYFKVIRAVQSLNPYAETKEEREREKEILPQWVKDGLFVELPHEDSYGRKQYLDTQYILPFNPVEAGSFRPGNPFFTLVSNLMLNKDSFTKKEIWSSVDDQKTKLEKQTQFVLRMLLPNNPIVPGSTSFDKLVNAITKRPDYQGRERDLVKVLLDIIGGIKVQPFDLGLEAQFRGKEKAKIINDLRFEMSKVQRSKTMTEQEKSKRMESLRNQLREIAQ